MAALLELISTIYLTINVFFACCYLAVGNGIVNAHHGSFMDAILLQRADGFPLSAMAAWSPRGMVANILVTVESADGVYLLRRHTG